MDQLSSVAAAKRVKLLNHISFIKSNKSIGRWVVAGDRGNIMALYGQESADVLTSSEAVARLEGMLDDLSIEVDRGTQG